METSARTIVEQSAQGLGLTLGQVADELGEDRIAVVRRRQHTLDSSGYQFRFRDNCMISERSPCLGPVDKMFRV
jgi:hypothetical protein